MTLRIGITGGIGAGKTMAARIFENLGVPVFYADPVARKLITENGSLRERIIDAFGPESYIGNKYNTSFIAGIVFNDKDKLRLINSIVHPFVQNAFVEWCRTHEGQPYLLKEAALLIESDAASFLDHIIVITAPLDIRIKRVVERDGITTDEVIKRVNSQLPEEEMLRRAHSVLRNDGVNLLIPQILELHNKFVSLWKEKQELHG